MLRILALPLLLLASCQSTSAVRPFVEPIERAHGAPAWLASEAALMDLEVDFGGQRMLDGTLLTAPDGARTRIETRDGSTIVSTGVSTGDSVHVSPSTAANPMMRFHALTWSYFLAAPFKLGDEGTMLSEMGEAQMNGKTYDLARLTFGADVGDAPDDWYILYRDAESGVLKAMAYIVTYGKDPAEVTDEDAHAIVYHDYKTVNGVAIPMRWSFHNWTRELGPHGDPIGEARLANFRFTSASEASFQAPQGSVAISAP